MSGVEYIKEDLTDHPQCVHGPTFLLLRETANGPKKFFACSACRDRKDCSFFIWEEDRKKNNTEDNVKNKQRLFASENHEELEKVLCNVQKNSEQNRKYCFTCNKFLLPKNCDNSHKIQQGITDKQLKYPSTFLEPLENDKIEAQYLFSESAVLQTIKILEDLNFQNVLCVGAPRIHEYIQNQGKNMKSVLFDFDRRYYNFYSPKHFIFYNMFNHHFFKTESKKHYLNFIKNENIVLIMDPPFGGRIEPLSETIYSIERDIQKIRPEEKLTILFFMPYFMESHIKNHINLEMADYKVNYDNHSLFTKEKGRKFGSPVRIFTNIPLNKLKLDSSEYHFCEFCEKYVYNENKHCYLCNSCTSKDGRTYIHCKKCNRCVKPTWVHCAVCKKCAQPDHKCGENIFKQSCFHCHEKGHKKSECPKVNVEEIKRKRKQKKGANKKFKNV